MTDHEQTTNPVQRQAQALDRAISALRKLHDPIPSTKGMAPKDRANRLHAELERRILVARDALNEVVFGIERDLIMRLEIDLMRQPMLFDTEDGQQFSMIGSNFGMREIGVTDWRDLITLTKDEVRGLGEWLIAKSLTDD